MIAHVLRALAKLGLVDRRRLNVSHETNMRASDCAVIAKRCQDHWQSLAEDRR